MEQQFLTVREVAGELRHSEAHVKRQVRAGKIKSVRFGDGPTARILIRRQDLDEYIESRVVRGVAA